MLSLGLVLGLAGLFCVYTISRQMFTPFHSQPPPARPIHSAGYCWINDNTLQIQGTVASPLKQKNGVYALDITTTSDQHRVFTATLTFQLTPDNGLLTGRYDPDNPNTSQWSVIPIEAVKALLKRGTTITAEVNIPARERYLLEHYHRIGPVVNIEVHRPSIK